jgi:hypothetical protein
MTDGIVWPPQFPRARGLRIAARMTLIAWIATLLAFILLVGLQASGRILAALGGLASVLFATSFVFHALASRRELRELTAQTLRNDLRAARSRR